MPTTISCNGTHRCSAALHTMVTVMETGVTTRLHTHNLGVAATDKVGWAQGVASRPCSIPIVTLALCSTIRRQFCGQFPATVLGTFPMGIIPKPGGTVV